MDLGRIAIISMLAVTTEAIIGYDCGSGEIETTISLLKVGTCDLPFLEPEIEPIDVQLVQVVDYSEVKIFQCKVEIRRSIFHCGTRSDISAVTNGQAEYIRTVSEEECLNMHRYKSWKFGTHGVISELESNDTITSPLSLGGGTGDDGPCDGTRYADEYGSWDKVVVQGTIKISLRDYNAKVNLNSNDIVFQSGTYCRFDQGSCVDGEGGNTYWENTPRDSCHLDRYEVIYQGNANKIRSGIDQVYTLTTGSITFALTKTGNVEICGLKIVRTEHPELLIVEDYKKYSIFQKRPPSTGNLDIFTYLNSKLAHVEKHIRTQMTTLHRDIVRQKCESERRVLENSLAMASLAPDTFAHRIMGGPGYMGITAGEVVYIIKCVPVEVSIRRAKGCYQELPVHRGSTAMFLSPKSRILRKTGVQIECNPFIPPMYRIDEGWVTLLPLPTEPVEPGALVPLTKDNTMITIVENTWTRIMGWFFNVGATGAGILGLWVIFRGISLLIATRMP